MRKIIIIFSSLIASLIILCGIADNNPLDETGSNYQPPQILIDSGRTTVNNGDTIKVDSIAVYINGNKEQSRFRYKLDSANWSTWDTIGDIKQNKIIDGKHTLYIETKYEGGSVFVSDSINFFVVLKGYRPFFAQLPDSNLIFTANDKCSLSVNAGTIVATQYQWYKDSGILNGKTDSKIGFQNIQLNDSGKYQCVAFNDYGRDTSRIFAIHVKNKPDTLGPGNDTTKPSIRIIDPAKDSLTINAPFKSIQIAIKDTVGISRVRVSVGADTFTVARTGDTLWSATIQNMASNVFTPIKVEAWDGAIKPNTRSVTFYIQYIPAGKWPKAVSQNVSTNEDVAIAVTLTAVAETGKTITAWEIIQQPKNGTLSGNGSTRTYTPTSGFTASDTFTFRASDGTSWSDTASMVVSIIPRTHFKITTISSGGTVGLQPVGPDFDSGTTVTLTAIPSAGHRFVSWSGDITGTTSPAQIKVTSNKTVTASFIRQYVLTVSANPAEGGSVTGAGTFDSGIVNPIGCTTASGYQFTNWAITTGPATWAAGSNATTASSNVLLTGNATVTANFLKLVAPTISKQPTALQIARIGDTITLSVSATGTPLPKFQWYKNGSALNGKTDSILSIKGIQRADSGTYYVAVTNTAQNISSHDAVVDVRYAKAVYAGSSILFITNDGALWGCGSNWTGQLGDGTKNDVLKPKQIMADVVAAGSSAYNSLMLKKNGTLWGCGSNDFGQLGDTLAISYLNPKQVASGPVTAFSAATNLCYYVLNTHLLWACGQNAAGTLGDGTTNNRNTYDQVPNLSDVATVYSFAGSAFILTTTGILWAWGDNSYGQLGDNTYTQRLTPVQIMPDVSSIAVGQWHTLILKTNGTLLGCGYNHFNQLGNLADTVKTPTPIPGITGVIAISAGGMHSLALKNDKTLWAFGANHDGQAGDSISITITNPKKIADSVIAISGGINLSSFIKTDGTLWGCGNLRVGDSTTSTKPALFPKRIF